MGKKEELIKHLKTIKDDTVILESYLVTNSNLPGPRSNLELAFAFAEVYENMDVLSEWLKITAGQADVNDPRSFLAFCAAVCLGKIYTKSKKSELISILKNLANDPRWRMKEAVAFAFQFIGENDFDELKSITSEWITNSNNDEKRAILVSLAHPPFLNAENAEYCLEIADTILNKMDTENNFEVLKKGLNFTISVFVAANPEAGFKLIERWIGKSKIIDKVLKENLKKNRIQKKYPEETNRLSDVML